MEIHVATLQDAPAIGAMAIAFRNHLERSTPSDAQLADSISTLLLSSDAEFYLAVDGDVPLGYVLQRYRYSMWAGGTEAAIEDLFVDPVARKKGIGRELIRYALRMAIRRSCASICLDTNENNAASTRIYSQLGFNAVSKRWSGRQIFFRRNLQDALALPANAFQ